MSPLKAGLIMLLIGLGLFAVGRWGVTGKPFESSLINVRAKAPLQSEIPAGSAEAAPFDIGFEKKHYKIFPKANYVIEGLIVSQHRADSVFDLMHLRTGDTLNSRDICTVWGQMLAAGVYRDVKFWSGDWTCYYRFSDAETAAVFKADQISNTHVLANKPDVRAKLAELEIGDEYRMRGRLVDYELEGVGRRNTSLVRTDTENGACETLYVDSIEILKSHNRVFRIVRDFGWWLTLLGFTGVLATMLRTIFFSRQTSKSVQGLLAFLYIASAIAVAPSAADAKICDASKDYCGDFTGSSSSSSTNSAGRASKIRINPSLIPIGKGFGAEFIYFDSEVDFAIVKGLGRIGAAISPSNSEETFFGPPGIETPNNLLERKRGQHKFPNQKITLGTGFGLYDNKRSGFERLSFNLGVMGRYNKLSTSIKGGGGLSGIIGPLTLGFSSYSDETQLEGPEFPNGPVVFPYAVSTFSVGAFYSGVAVDYSILQIESETDANVSVLTGTVIWKNSLLTAAMRTENLTRPSYDYATDSVILVDKKVEYFGGVQVSVWDPLLLGVFYNYYLMHEISFGATLFF